MMYFKDHVSNATGILQSYSFGKYFIKLIVIQGSSLFSVEWRSQNELLAGPENGIPGVFAGICTV